MFYSFKLILLDVLKLFKNFIHFTISKILIFISSFFIWVLASSPFFLLFFLFWFLFKDLDWMSFLYSFFWSSIYDLSAFSIIFSQPYLLFLEIVFLVLTFLFFLIGVSYSKILLYNLSKSYINTEKLGFFKNIYFSPAYIVKFYKIIWFLILFWLIPVVWFILISLVIIYFNTGFSSIEAIVWVSNTLSYTLLALFAISVILFVYIYYRLSFSNIILVEEWAWNKAFYYLKKSFELTRWYKVLFRFLLYILFFMILVFPLSYYQESNSDKLDRIKDYIDYGNWKTFDEFYQLELDMDFASYDKEYILTEYKTAFILKYIYSILNFLFVLWVFEMFFVSFYHRVLINHSLLNISKKDDKNDSERASLKEDL